MLNDTPQRLELYETVRLMDEVVLAEKDISEKLRAYLSAFVEEQDPRKLEEMYEARFALFWNKQYPYSLHEREKAKKQEAKKLLKETTGFEGIPEADEITQEYSRIIKSKIGSKDPENRISIKELRARGKTQYDDEVQHIQENSRIAVAVEEMLDYHPMVKTMTQILAGFSEKERIEIAKLIIQKNRIPTLSAYMHNLKITSEEKRIEIAKLAAQKDGESLSLYFELYDITSQKARIEIAKIVALKYHNFCSYISNFQIESQEGKVEIAKIVAENFAETLSACIQDYGITSEEDRIQIAKIAAVKAPHKFSLFLENYNIQSEERRIEIAKLVAQNHSYSISTQIQKYKISSEKERIEIAKIAIRNNGYSVAEYIENYEMNSEEVRIEIAKIIMSTLTYYDPQILNFIKSFRIKKFEHRLEIFKIFIEHFPQALEDVFHLWKKRSFEKTSLTFSNPEAFMCHMAIMQKKNSQMLPPQITHLYADTHRLETGKRLIAGFFGYPHDQFTNDPKRNSRIALKNITGFPSEYLRDDIEYSERALSNLYDLVLEIQRKAITLPAFSFLKLDPTLFKDKKLQKLLRFLKSLNNILQVCGMKAHEMYLPLLLSIEKIHQGEVKAEQIKTKTQIQEILGDEVHLTPSIEISDSSIVTLSGILEETFFSWFQETFSVDLKAKLDYEDIIRLEQKWGDLHPFYVLASRYHGKSSWNQEIPTLGRIVNTTLKDSFPIYKYEGYSDDSEDKKSAHNQLSMLNKDQTEAWKTNPSSLTFFDPAEYTQQQNAEDLLAQCQKIYQHNLLPHISSQTLALFQDLSFQQKCEKISAEPIKKDVLEKYFSPLSSKDYLKSDMIVAYCIYKIDLALQSKNINSLENLLRQIRSFIDAYVSDQVRADFKSMSESLKSVKSEKPAFIFTTIFDDPKLLLTIGDLVDVSSCQNYLTGIHIETLPGYVIDANVKGIASFAIEPYMIQPQQDFDMLAKVLKNNPADVYYDFNPSQKILTIQFQNKTYRVAFEKAYHRQVIKLGATDNNKPGLRLEPAYTQNHGASLKMSEDIQNLYTRFARNIKAHTDKQITIPASRNPGGVYSDLFGGVVTEEYSIV